MWERHDLHRDTANIPGEGCKPCPANLAAGGIANRPEAPQTPMWWQRASPQTLSPAALQILISMISPPPTLRATLHHPLQYLCPRAPSELPILTPAPHKLPCLRQALLGSCSAVTQHRTPSYPADAHTGLVNDPAEHCQNLATAQHHHREQKQGKPFLACPKATNKRGRSHRAGKDPELPPAHGCVGVAGGQNSLPRKDPRTFCNQTASLMGKQACK